MPGGRICKLCADSRTMEGAAQLIAEGVSDQSIADQLGLAGAAGRMIVNARRSVPTSKVRATLSHSRRTDATPNAVLISIGHSEQIKMTKIDDRLESLIV